MLGRACRFAAILFLGGGFGASISQANEVEGVRLWASPESTRVVLDLDRPTAHNVFSLDNPSRLVIDLDGSRLSASARIAQARGLVSNLRTGTRPGGALRVVLDLNQPSQASSFVLEPNDIYGYRLVVDLVPTMPAPPAVRRAPRADTPGGRPVVIAIDAGHGGEDPGAIGPGGTREKHIVLGISRYLAEEVRAQHRAFCSYH